MEKTMCWFVFRSKSDFFLQVPQHGTPVPSRVSQSDALDAREETGSVNEEGTTIDVTAADTQPAHPRELQKEGELEKSD